MPGSRDESEVMAKLVWRVTPVTELQVGETTEVDVACIERDQQGDLSDLGFRLAEAKQLTSALQGVLSPSRQRSDLRLGGRPVTRSAWH
jgi:hypothetical protein